MLDNILLENNKAKFMSTYSKLANELDNFTALNRGDKSPSQIQKKQNFLSKENRMNFLLSERLKNNKQEAKNILSGKEREKIIEKDIFSEDLSKLEKWKGLKNSLTKIKPINNNNNANDLNNLNNNGNLYEKVRNNLNEMRRQFNLEETFKNNNNLLEYKVISPKNNIIYNNNSNRKANFSAMGNKGNNINNIEDIRKVMGLSTANNTERNNDLRKMLNFDEPLSSMNNIRGFNVNNLNNNSNKNFGNSLKNKFNFFYDNNNVNNINSNDIENFNNSEK